MFGKWDRWYRGLKVRGTFKYGDTVSYQKAADFLKDLAVYDLGCGAGHFKTLHNARYWGVDGSCTPFADIYADLREFRPKYMPEGILLRHVLEHNPDWKMVLENAIESFTKRLCIVIFTPFGTETKVIAENKKHGVDVPDISFKAEDLEAFFDDFNWSKEIFESKTHYGQETIYYIEK